MLIDNLLNSDDLRFRDGLRAFIATALPDSTRRKVRAGAALDKADYVDWQRALATRGWLTPHWPQAEGGAGWSVVRQYLFEEELAAAHCPQIALTLAVGPRMVGPILCQHGSAAQRQRWLPGIRDASVWWCQGYSEPEAGSDLASLRTRGSEVPGGWRVSGAKTWTSYAHWADCMACLVRTGDPAGAPQKSVSFMVIDMRARGVTVRPIQGANGRHFFNEVFLDDVFVPAADVIGPVHGGWSLAKALLEHERLNAARVAETRKKLDWALALLHELHATTRSGPDPSGPDPAGASATLLARLAMLEAGHRALQALVLRFVSQAAQGQPIGPQASLLKLRGTELLQEVMDLITDTLMALDAGRCATARNDHAALPDVATTDEAGLERLARHHHLAHALYTRGFTIAAGTSEVQRNVIARQVLGLAAAT